MAKTEIIIGSRGSQLALWQSNFVKNLLENSTQELICTIKVIQTRGDEDQSIPLPDVGDKGFFTEEIESELKTGDIDMAVHSLKDLPVQLGDDFTIGAVIKRDSPFDVLIHHGISSVDSLPKKAVIATSSVRRKVQLKNYRTDLKFVDVRGNILTRIEKLQKNKWDGLIMAEAALNRLNLQNLNYKRFTLDQMIPAAGQGAIAVQILKGRSNLKKIVSQLNHQDSALETQIERKFVDEMGGGCQHPIAAYAKIDRSNINMVAMVASLDGTQSIKVKKSCSLQNPESVLNEVLSEMKKKGADKIIGNELEFSGV